MDDPFKILGVEASADESEVKRAYRKLALRYHPDVSKDDLAEAKFRALREAYELLLGKGVPAAGDGGRKAPFGGNWDLHDWYWSFGMRQRQQRQNPDSAPVHSAAAAQRHRPQVHSQLTSLKQRAARRQHRPSDAFAAGEAAAADAAAAARPATVEAPSAQSMPPRPSATPANQGNAAAAGRLGALLGATQLFEDARSAACRAVGGERGGMPAAACLFCLSAPLPAPPLSPPGRRSAGTQPAGDGRARVRPQAVPEARAYSEGATAAGQQPSPEGCSAEDERPAEEAGAGAGPRFAATDEHRSAVKQQLVGLKRRAGLKPRR